jgi:hypothetical protein
MINYLFDKIKKTFLNLYDFLQEEPEYKHPKLRFIPSFVLNLLLLIFWIIVFLSFIKFLIKTLINFNY